jgi:plasmid stabilization system protein ParE
MVGFVLTKEALDELDKEIAYSKQRWGVAKASLYRRELLALVRKISENPEGYAENPLYGSGFRTVRFKGNRIVYTLNKKDKTVIILGFPSIYKAQP